MAPIGKQSECGGRRNPNRGIWSSLVHGEINVLEAQTETNLQFSGCSGEHPRLCCTSATVFSATTKATSGATHADAESDGEATDSSEDDCFSLIL
mmetsp:Transcript_8850/g.15933  ORF Transcript_8850/g.15933 Transcript_8850/m.15933 type:complete len:95 (+) Transcript_8850:615-899(+)